MTVMPTMDPTGRPVVLLPSEIRREKEENESKVKYGETRKGRGERAWLRRKEKATEVYWCVCCHNSVPTPCTNAFLFLTMKP